MENKEIYLDNSATTAISPEALDEYIRVSRELYGNPSSLHGVGVRAEEVLRTAEDELLSALFTSRGKVIFTGSGTEANNLAILGRAHAKDRFRRGACIITSEGEHPSVGKTAEALVGEGFRLCKIPTKGGVLDLSELRAKLSPEVILVSLMLVNNETGAVYNIPEAAKLIKQLAPAAYLHVDATQGFLKIPFSPEGLGADMVTVSAHKVHGPKGVGALYISERVLKEKGIAPIIYGGGQGGGLRSGTENLPGIAAFAKAASLGKTSLSEVSGKVGALRDRLICGITERYPEISITLPPMAAPHILNFTLPGIKSETMLHFLSGEGIFLSSGSACSSHSTHPSEALLAFGRSGSEADCSMRASLSHVNTEGDIDALLDALGRGLPRLARIKRK